MEPTVQVSGLKELRRDLRKLGTPDQMKELKAANATVANIIVNAARGQASTRMQQRAAATLRVSNSVYAAVRFGTGFRGAMGAEFGAARGMPRQGVPGFQRYTGWNQFEGWKGNGSEAGYFLWPAIRDKTGEVLNTYADELLRRFGTGEV